jgi:hypothetical protein
MVHGGLRTRGGRAHGLVGGVAKGKKEWGTTAAPARKGSHGRPVVRVVVRWLWHNGTWTTSSHAERHSWQLGAPDSELGGARGNEEAGCRRCPNRVTTEEEEGLRSAVPTGLKAHVPWRPNTLSPCSTNGRRRRHNSEIFLFQFVFFEIHILIFGSGKIAIRDEKYQENSGR